jgi:two-component system response regulator AtoC
MEGLRLSPELIEALRRADWPGNVRQLENAVARMVAMSGGGDIRADAFEPANAQGPAIEGALTWKEQLDAFERGLIAEALSAADGNQSEAARRLGMSRSSLIDRLKKYGLSSSAE